MHSKKNTTTSPGEQPDFIKLFPKLDALSLADDELRKLAEAMKEGEEAANPSSDSKVISNGLSIFSQFLAHDITFERGSNLSRDDNSINAFRNDRTIQLDLDCIYGQKSQSFYYNKKDPDKLLLGQKYKYEDLTWYDLQRNKNHIAIIPDARNDENIIVSRLQVLFIQFHNKMVDYLRANKEEENNVFAAARKSVIWHYHWLILHEYLYKIMDWSVFHKILKDGSKYYQDSTSLPLEFSGAAFRVGHSQTREFNRINDLTEKKLLELGFFQTMDEYVDWHYIFDFGDGKCQFGKLIDSQIGNSFHQLPFLKGQENSLPFLNLKRGVAYGLPSGEDVARTMDFEPIEISETRHLSGTPLWFYILSEAAQLGHEGEHLGPVGSTILGECFYTILKKDQQSYLHAAPHWRPTIGKEPGFFNFTDMVRFILE